MHAASQHNIGPHGWVLMLLTAINVDWSSLSPPPPTWSMFECIITHYSYSRVTGNPLIYSRVTGNPLIQSPDLSHNLSSKFELCKVDIILWGIYQCRSTAVSSLPLVRIVAISPGPNYCLYHLGACGTILGAEVLWAQRCRFWCITIVLWTRFVASQHPCACWTATNFGPHGATSAADGIILGIDGGDVVGSNMKRSARWAMAWMQLKIFLVGIAINIEWRKILSYRQRHYCVLVLSASIQRQ